MLILADSDFFESVHVICFHFLPIVFSFGFEKNARKGLKSSHRNGRNLQQALPPWSQEPSGPVWHRWYKDTNTTTAAHEFFASLVQQRSYESRAEFLPQVRVI